MFTITRAWLHEHGTKHGVGWSAKQLATIGVSWPPRKGWLTDMAGRQIADEQRRAFEKLRRQSQ